MGRIKYVIAIILLLCTTIVKSQDLDSVRVQRPKVGVVLSGGGAKGVAHIGALRVLEEKGIPIDYIAGTSMGSLVGGLYAVGYPLDSIESIIKSMDWQALIKDIVPRDYVSFDMRENFGKYLVSVYFDDQFKVELRRGVVRGQNLQLFINKYFWNQFDNNDFSKYQIPFFCVGADLITGKPIVLDKGILPEALRASIAVPLAFTPMRIDSLLMVDGGVYDNFPTQAMKEKGVDIIIGVNVGFQPFTKDDLKSIINVANQLMWVNNVDKNIESKKYCDILIEPDVSSVKSTSFKDVDTLIALGKDAALRQSKSIDSLSNYLHICGRTPQESSLDAPEMKHITLMKINGLDDEDEENYFLDNLLLPYNEPVDADIVNEAILHERGTMAYKSVRYSFDTASTLIFDIEKKEFKYNLRLGVNFDTYTYGKVLLNFNVNNVIISPTRLDVNLELSRNPGFELSYYYTIDRFARVETPGERISMLGFTVDLFSDNVFEWEDSRKMNDLRMVSNDYKLFYQSHFGNHFMFETGLNEKLFWDKVHISDRKQSNSFQSVLSVYASLDKDDRNDAEYPTKGERLKIVADCQWNTNNNDIPFNLNAYVDYSHLFRFGEKLFFTPELFVGYNSNTYLSSVYTLFYVGGEAPYKAIHGVKLTGYDQSELLTNNVTAAYLNLRWNVSGNHNVLFKLEAASISEEFLSLFKFNDLCIGSGIGYSFNSIVGPLEVILSRSFTSNHHAFWLNLGYHF